MNILNAAVLGIVEGITEFLPISSTGHMVLASELMHLAQSEFVKSFEIIIQLGAILAVVVLFWKKYATDWQCLGKAVLAFIPTGILGFIFYKTVRQYIGNESVILWALLLGGLLIILFEYFYETDEIYEGDISVITSRQAIAIGVMQSVSMIPGVSRSAITIISGLFMGIPRKAIVEFSFILAVITMLAATSYDFIKNYNSFSVNQFDLLAIGFIASFITAIFAVKFMMKFIQNHTFRAFGYYRIIIAVLFWLIILR
jgi:undecaprenyl-diphosphatase